jgi:hypothetical protein
MSYIEMNLDDVTEPKPAGQGKYELQITSATPKESGQNSKHPGTPMLQVTLGFTDPEMASVPTFSHFIVFPYKGQENDYYTKLNIKRFLTQFGVSYNPDLEQLALDLVARTAVCEVGLTEPREGDGAVYNTLKLDRLPEQNIASGTKRKRG